MARRGGTAIRRGAGVTIRSRVIMDRYLGGRNTARPSRWSFGLLVRPGRPLSYDSPGTIAGTSETSPHGCSCSYSDRGGQSRLNASSETGTRLQSFDSSGLTIDPCRERGAMEPARPVRDVASLDRGGARPLPPRPAGSARPPRPQRRPAPHTARRSLLTGADLVTYKQQRRVKDLFAVDDHGAPTFKPCPAKRNTGVLSSSSRTRGLQAIHQFLGQALAGDAVHALDEFMAETIG